MEAPCTRMEAHVSCCCLGEHAVNGSSNDGTAIAISHFLFSPLDHRIHLGPPRNPILCHFHPFCANTLSHCLLPSPHPDPTFVTLRSQPFHSSNCDSFHAVDPFLSNAPHDRTTKSSLRSTFHHHVRFCALPDSCAVVLPTVSCVLQVFQWVVQVRISFVSASCLVLLAGECIVTVSVQLPDASTWMTQRMMTAQTVSQGHFVVTQQIRIA